MTTASLSDRIVIQSILQLFDPLPPNHRARRRLFPAFKPPSEPFNPYRLIQPLFRLINILSHLLELAPISH